MIHGLPHAIYVWSIIVLLRHFLRVEPWPGVHDTLLSLGRHATGYPYPTPMVLLERRCDYHYDLRWTSSW